MQIYYYYSKICKNYFKIEEKKKDWNDMAVDVVQCECSNIECYASAFSNIQNIDQYYAHAMQGLIKNHV